MKRKVRPKVDAQKRRSRSGAVDHRGSSAPSHLRFPAALPSIRLREPAMAENLSAAHGGGVAALLDVERQCHENWCWAAIAVSVARGLARPAPSQCEFAFEQLQRSERPPRRDECCGPACDGGRGGRCDQMWFLDRALAGLGLLRGQPIPGPVPLDLIRGSLEAGRPVCALAAPAHFVAIVGFTDRGDVTQFNLSDPLDGRRSVLEARGPLSDGLVHAGRSLTMFYFTQ